MSEQENLWRILAKERSAEIAKLQAEVERMKKRARADDPNANAWCEACGRGFRSLERSRHCSVGCQVDSLLEADWEKLRADLSESREREVVLRAALAHSRCSCGADCDHVFAGGCDCYADCPREPALSPEAGPSLRSQVIEECARVVEQSEYVRVYEGRQSFGDKLDEIAAVLRSLAKEKK